METGPAIARMLLCQLSAPFRLSPPGTFSSQAKAQAGLPGLVKPELERPSLCNTHSLQKGLKHLELFVSLSF